MKLTESVKILFLQAARAHGGRVAAGEKLVFGGSLVAEFSIGVFAGNPAGNAAGIALQVT
jgi:hypothetical protein